MQLCVIRTKPLINSSLQLSPERGISDIMYLMDKSVALAVCSGGSIKTDTVSCLLASVGHLPAKINLVLPVGGYVAQNRTMSVRMAPEYCRQGSKGQTFPGSRRDGQCVFTETSDMED